MDGSTGHREIERKEWSTAIQLISWTRKRKVPSSESQTSRLKRTSRTMLLLGTDKFIFLVFLNFWLNSDSACLAIVKREALLSSLGTVQSRASFQAPQAREIIIMIRPAHAANYPLLLPSLASFPPHAHKFSRQSFASYPSSLLACLLPYN